MFSMAWVQYRCARNPFVVQSRDERRLIDDRCARRVHQKGCWLHGVQF
jgi:hypothetical protein